MGQSSGISLVLCRVEYNNKLKKERMSQQNGILQIFKSIWHASYSLYHDQMPKHQGCILMISFPSFIAGVGSKKSGMIFRSFWLQPAKLLIFLKFFCLSFIQRKFCALMRSYPQFLHCNELMLLNKCSWRKRGRRYRKQLFQQNLIKGQISQKRRRMKSDAEQSTYRTNLLSKLESCLHVVS